MHFVCHLVTVLGLHAPQVQTSAHEFALLDMAFSRSERFAMARHQPGRESSAYLFFPVCQLCASAPEQVDQVYTHLCSALPDGVGLMLDCCAAPACWAGRREMFEGRTAHLKARWEALGRPRLILACATRFETQVQDCVRRLIAGRCIEIEELALGGENTECCGFGGLMFNANPELAGAVTRGRGVQPAGELSACSAKMNGGITQNKVYCYFSNADGFRRAGLRTRP